MIHDRVFHLSDLHFWEIVTDLRPRLNTRFFGDLNVRLKRQHEFIKHRAEEFADYLATLEPRLAVISGDFSSTSTHEEFALGKAFCERLAAHGFHIWVMPGNHDYYTKRAVRERRFETYFGDFMPEGGLPGRVDLPGGTPLIVVPTTMNTVFTACGYISDTELARTQALLADCPADRPVLVAGHYPLLPTTPAYHNLIFRRLVGEAKLRTLLGESGRQILYLSGHVHTFSWVIDPLHPSLQHLVSPPFLFRDEEAGTHGGFCEVEVYADHFGVHLHECSEAWARQTREPVALA